MTAFFNMDSRGLNLGPHACVTGTVPAEPSPWTESCFPMAELRKSTCGVEWQKTHPWADQSITGRGQGQKNFGTFLLTARYLLAHCHIQTHRDGPWASCTPSPDKGCSAEHPRAEPASENITKRDEVFCKYPQPPQQYLFLLWHSFLRTQLQPPAAFCLLACKKETELPSIPTLTLLLSVKRVSKHPWCFLCRTDQRQYSYFFLTWS